MQTPHLSSVFGHIESSLGSNSLGAVSVSGTVCCLEWWGLGCGQPARVGTSSEAAGPCSGCLISSLPTLPTALALSWAHGFPSQSHLQNQP